MIKYRILTFREALQSASKIQLVADRDAGGVVTLRFPGMIPIPVPVEAYNSFAHEEWGDRAVLPDTNDRARIVLADVKKIHNFISQFHPQLHTFLLNLDFTGKVDASEDWWEYLTGQVT